MLQPGLAQILREREGEGESSEKRETRGKSKANEVGRGGKVKEVIERKEKERKGGVGERGGEGEKKP